MPWPHIDYPWLADQDPWDQPMDEPEQQHVETGLHQAMTEQQQNVPEQLIQGRQPPDQPAAPGIGARDIIWDNEVWHWYDEQQVFWCWRHRTYWCAVTGFGVW